LPDRARTWSTQMKAAATLQMSRGRRVSTNSSIESAPGGVRSSAARSLDALMSPVEKERCLISQREFDPVLNQ
jgi:hypothetical protein